MTTVLIDRSFALHYQADGRQVGLVGWPEGSAGWWDIDRCGREAALAPGLEAFRAAFANLIPEAAPSLAALTSVEQLVYREIPEVHCEEWWVPGLVVIGDAAHAVGPESGLGASLGFGDALALAIAIERNDGDPDGACRDYELWRRPMVRPYEEIGAAGSRIVRGGEKPPGGALAAPGLRGRPHAGVIRRSPAARRRGHDASPDREAKRMTTTTSRGEFLTAGMRGGLALVAGGSLLAVTAGAAAARTPETSRSRSWRRPPSCSPSTSTAGPSSGAASPATSSPTWRPPARTSATTTTPWPT